MDPRANKLHREHPVRHITSGPEARQRLVPWVPHNQRVGRPSFKWGSETIERMWSASCTHTYRKLSIMIARMHEAIKHDRQIADANLVFSF